MAKKIKGKKGTQSGEAGLERIEAYARPQVDKRTAAEKRRDARRAKVKNISKDELYSTGETAYEKFDDFINKMDSKLGAAIGQSPKSIESKQRRRLNMREMSKQIDEAQALRDERMADRRYQQKQRKEADAGVRKRELEALGLKKGGKVKAKKKTTRKFRGDGIAKKGKTKGRFV
jgi:hypothetical protein